VDGDECVVESTSVHRFVHVVSVPTWTIGSGESTRASLVVSSPPLVIPTIHSSDDDNDEFYSETETPGALASSLLGTMEAA
jgi:hypothetical protein